MTGAELEEMVFEHEDECICPWCGQWAEDYLGIALARERAIY
ncbi:MAG: hypothetical protein ACREA4_00420 [Nitrososphaera sp.]